MQEAAVQDTSPLVPTEVFKTLMRGVPGPATIITAFDGDGTAKGLTMSAVCSVSLTPRLLLICLDLGSNTLAAIKESREFTVNFLTRGAEDIAMHFASKRPSKFDGINFARSEVGIGGPILEDSCAAFAACRVQQLIEAGDHIIVVGEVSEARVWAERPSLTYANRQFFDAPFAN